MKYNEVKINHQLNIKRKNTERFYRVVTSIQAITIIGVIIWHMGDITSLRFNSNILIRTFFEITESSVDIFIFLSGMLLTIGLIRENKTKFSWIIWYKRRIIRIYPLLIISTFIFLLNNYYLFRDVYSINSVIIHMSGLQSQPTNPDFFLLASPHWYITLILSCYLLFPFFFYFIRKNAKLAAIVGVLLYICYLFTANIIFELTKDFTDLILHRNLYLWYYSLFFLRFFIFFFGMLFGSWIGSDFKRIEFFQKKKVGIIAFLLLILVISFFFFFPITNSTFLDFRRILYHPLIAILLTVFSIFFLSKQVKINNILKIPGKGSYEIYLFHLIIVEILYYKVIEFFLLEDIIELYIIIIPVLIILSIISTVPLYLLNKFFKNTEKIHRTILMLSFSLITYAIIVFLFNLELIINNFQSILLFISILLTLIFLNFFKSILIKKKNLNLGLIEVN